MTVSRETMIDDNLTVLIKRLDRYADDPMWDAHAEVPKILLREAIAALRSQGESMTEGDRLAKFNQIRSTLAFFRSVIQCGEEWSSTCDREYEMAKAHLGELTAALSPPGHNDTEAAFPSTERSDV
jgi:hypothetical protein